MALTATAHVESEKINRFSSFQIAHFPSFDGSKVVITHYWNLGTIRVLSHLG